MKILYFTSTGNSLDIAKRIGGELISIPQVMKNNEYHFEDDEAIGLISPCYSLTVPKIVKEFLAKAEIKSPYNFLIVTYGNAVGDAIGWTTRYAKEYGIDFAYGNHVLMIDNYLPQYDLNRQFAKEKHTEEAIEKILTDIQSRKRMINKAGVVQRGMTKMLLSYEENHPDMFSPDKFQVSDDCISCGICSNVCPRGNVDVKKGGNPTFGSNCEFCLGCVHNCPKMAIKIKKEANPNVRFRNENVTVQEIVKANKQ